MSIKTIHIDIPVGRAAEVVANDLNCHFILKGQQDDLYQICYIQKFNVSSDESKIIATAKSFFFTKAEIESIMQQINAAHKEAVFVPSPLDGAYIIKPDYIEMLRNTEDKAVITEGNRVLLAILSAENGAVISATGNYDYNDFLDGSIVNKIFDGNKGE